MKDAPGLQTTDCSPDVELDAIASLMNRQLGLRVDTLKQSLTAGKLNSILRRHGFTSYAEYRCYLANDKSGDAFTELVDAITTHHTYFFRESDHFHFLYNSALPALTTSLRQTGCHDLRLWCTACSTGEEAYTLAMVLHDYMSGEQERWDAGVLATDVSRKAIKFASEGVYKTRRLQRVPERSRLTHFSSHGDRYKVGTALKSLITFRRFNLMTTHYPFRRPFHVIFCRNVLIYFDDKTRSEVIRQLYNCTAQNGFLFLGQAELLTNDECLFRSVAPAVYQRVN